MALSLFVLNSCETMDDDGGQDRNYAPTVTMPDDLSDNESRLIGAVENVLEDAGYRTTRSRGEFELEFKVDDGPINADVYLTLTRDGSTVAKAYSRVSGPMLFKRQELIRESFEKCLRDFDRQLPSTRYDRGSSRDRYDDRDRPVYHDDNSYMPRQNYNPEYDRADPRYYQ